MAAISTGIADRLARARYDAFRPIGISFSQKSQLIEPLQKKNPARELTGFFKAGVAHRTSRSTTELI
jgi:hypothetical protein